MTITEQKAFLRIYTGQAQAPADFAQRWQETAAALHPAVSCAPVAFGNTCGVYERLTVTFDGRSVTARVIRPAADGVHPLLMYHDLNRGVRGWHHITRFLALGFGGGLALLAASLCPAMSRCAALNPLPGDFAGLGLPGYGRVGCSEFRTALLCRGAAGHLSDGRVRPAQGSGRDLQPPDLS